MLNILAAILLFGFIVMFHELGHFLLAKLNRVGVMEFSIGMGPRLFSFQGKKTRYSLKALPLGGSCAMVDYRDLGMFLQLHPETRLKIRYGRSKDGQGADPEAWYADDVDYEVGTTELVTIFNEESQSYMMGIEHLPQYHPPKGFFHLCQLGWHEVMFQGRAAIESFGLLFRGYLGTEDLGGPVRIVADIGQVVEEVRPAGWLSVLLPALDGGRLAFLLIEAVRGKAIDQEKEGMVHMVGLMLLMGLMLLIMFNDIRNLMVGWLR